MPGIGNQSAPRGGTSWAIHRLSPCPAARHSWKSGPHSTLRKHLRHSLNIWPPQEKARMHNTSVHLTPNSRTRESPPAEVEWVPRACSPLTSGREPIPIPTTAAADILRETHRCQDAKMARRGSGVVLSAASRAWHRGTFYPSRLSPAIVDHPRHVMQQHHPGCGVICSSLVSSLLLLAARPGQFRTVT